MRVKARKASYEIVSCPGNDVLLRLEECARTCYQSHDKARPGSAEKLLRSIIARGHESVLEHLSITVRFICDRGVSHELVRHRLASFSQESTRYCNLAGKQMEFIKPCFWGDDSPELEMWEAICRFAEQTYTLMVEMGAKPEEARSVLPNSLKTEIVVTANIREWRHILKLRTAKAAHPQMRELMVPLLYDLRSRIPVLFDDISAVEGEKDEAVGQ